MYSTYGDRVYDPFLGTGTTTLAAMLAGRDSVGRELDPDLLAGFDDRIADLSDRSEKRVTERLDRHRAFVRERDSDPEYEAVHYDFPVVTKQERRIRLYDVTDVTDASDVTDTDADSGGEHAADTGGDDRRYVVSYEPW